MTEITTFIVDNYIWFIIGGIVLIMALIGYLAEKQDFGKKTIEKKVKDIEESEEVNDEKVIEPGAIKVDDNVEVKDSEMVSDIGLPDELYDSLDTGETTSEDLVVEEPKLEETPELMLEEIGNLVIEEPKLEEETELESSSDELVIEEPKLEEVSSDKLEEPKASEEESENNPDEEEASEDDVWKF